MKKYYLKPEYIKRIRPNNYKRIEENVQPNILKRDFKANKPNQKWTTDITYLIFQNRRLYLSTILDLYDIPYSFCKEFKVPSPLKYFFTTSSFSSLA